MKTFGYGINSLHKTAHICLEEGPWWAFALKRCVSTFCSWLPGWQIPILSQRKIMREGEEYTFGQWYGGIHSLFHLFICSPAFDWVYDRHIKETLIPIDYQQCRDIFYERDKAFWDESEAFHS